MNQTTVEKVDPKDITIHSRPAEMCDSDCAERAARMFIEDTCFDAKHEFFKGTEFPSEEGTINKKCDSVTITITKHRGHAVRVQTMELYRDEEGNEHTDLLECVVVGNTQPIAGKLYDQLTRNPVHDLTGATVIGMNSGKKR